MTNYEHLSRLMPRQLAEELQNNLSELAVHEYCLNCEKEHCGCPQAESSGCSISTVDMTLWWLNQTHKEKEGKQ